MLIPGVRDLVKTLQTAPLEAKDAIDNARVDVQGAIDTVNDKGLGVSLVFSYSDPPTESAAVLRRLLALAQ